MQQNKPADVAACKVMLSFGKTISTPSGRILLPKTLPAAPIRWLFAAYQKAGDGFCRSVNFPKQLKWKTM